MSIQPPQGILNIPNATLRVGKLEVNSTEGLDTALNNIERNTILLEDTTEYPTTGDPVETEKRWGLKVPNIFVATFEIKGVGSSFNFRNNSNGDADVGYTLDFSGTTLTLKYNDASLTTAIIPNLDAAYGKVYLTYEKQYFTVTVDGTRVLTYKDDVTRTPPEGEYANFFTGTGGGFKNLKVVAGHLISDGTSNIAYVGGGKLDISGDLGVTSNTSILVGSDVVAEYTGPHDRPLRKYPEVAMTSASQGGYVVTPSTQNATNVAYHMFDGDRSTRWVAQGSTDSYDSSSPYLYNGSNSSSISDTSGTPHDGAFIKLELPKAIKLDYTIIRENTDPASRTPGKITFLGSTNGTDWTFLKEFSGMSNTALDETYVINETNYYNHFAFVVKNLSDGDGVLDLGEWELYGHEEGSGSIDTTLKSVYNVPATTGTQLEVYYDGRETSSYPESGVTVTDISPNTNNGTLNGGVGFDTTYKAFTFDDGTNDYIEGSVTAGTGAWSHSVAFWIKIDQIPSIGMAVYQIKDSSVADNADAADHTSPHLVIDGGTGYINNAFMGNPGQFLDDNGNRLVAQTGVWQHYVVQYDASNGGTNYTDRKLIINGHKEYYPAGGTATALSMVASNKLFIGCLARSTGFDYLFNGSIANFRLYSKALNADQVKELYDYQKDYFFGTHSSVTLHKGRFGVGTKEPIKELDVVGDVGISANLHMTTQSSILVDSNVVTEYTGPHDRPLRKYPEVAFPTQANGDIGDTTVTHKGYTLTSSTTYNFTNHNLTNALDGLTSTAWSGNLGNYTTTGLPESTTRGGLGDYIQLELPNAIKIQYTKIFSQQTAGYSNGPRDITLYGSNNGTDWTSIKVSTDLPLDGEALNTTVHVNSMTFYRYFRLEINKIWIDSGNATYPRIAEWELYGYEEGSGSLDTTLKSVYNVPATTGTQLEVYYDAKDLTAMPSTVTDLSPNSNGGSVTGATLDTTDGIESFKFIASSSQYIEKVFSGYTQSAEYSASVWFKSDSYTSDSTIFQLGLGDHNDGSGIGMNIESEGPLRAYIYGYGSSSQVSTSVDSIATGTWYHATATYYSSGKIELYVNGVLVGEGKATQLGTINASAPLTLGTYYLSSTRQTPSFNGSIANFRLYSKALNAGQIKELYDYQKDYFLGSKSQVTLYKGHLGVGVTEPSGQLELAGDERIQSIPPRGLERTPREVYDGMTADEFVEGHGVFNVSASGGQLPDYNGAQLVFRRQSPFTAVVGDLNYWSRASVYNSSGAHIGDAKTSMKDGSTLNGEWIQLSSPYGYYLKKTVLYHRYVNNTPTWERARMPKDFTFVGSNNGSSWSIIKSFGNISYEALTGKDLEIDSKNVYKDVRLIVHSIVAVNPDGVSGNETNLDIGQWRLFGTPGPTTLDKGLLTLGRSLDVPRVSRYDVDTETPRPEKLVVDFDTTVNSSPTDISGQGNHGTFYNGASYSPADKAFNFDASTEYIESTLNNTGDTDISVSLWLKREADTTGTVWMIGNPTQTNGQNLAFDIYLASTNQIYLWTLDGPTLTDVDGGSQFPQNQWVHVVGTRTGTTLKLYIDGVDWTPNMTFSTGASGLALPANSNFRLGLRMADNVAFTGKISNSKVYDVVLEPSEVKKLYNLGRTGRSMVISDTAVGIGKVPEAQLDVRGTARFDTISDFLKIDHPGSQLSIGRSDEYANEFKWYTWADGCNWFTPYTGKSIWIGRDGQTISEFDFFNVTTVKRGTSIISSSDDRLKRDETFITNATNSILKLKPQTYIKKHRLPENENDTDIPEQFEAGLIAQDVWYDAPELRFLVHPSKDANPSETKPISPDPNDPTQDPDYSSWGTTQAYVNYEGFLPYLIKSNQEIYTELQAEKAKNESLETQVSDLLVRVTALENA